MSKQRGKSKINKPGVGTIETNGDARFNMTMNPTLRRVLREMAARRDQDMRQVLMLGWLRSDLEALNRYFELKKESE